MNDQPTSKPGVLNKETAGSVIQHLSNKKVRPTLVISTDNTSPAPTETTETRRTTYYSRDAGLNISHPYIVDVCVTISSSPNCSCVEKWLSNHTMPAKILSHLSKNGSLAMVDVSKKIITNREAMAKGKVLVGGEAFSLILSNKIQKGDVLTVARIAGIQAAKQTSSLIPLCHPLLLSKIDVDCQLVDSDFSILIKSHVVCDGKTGVEMEAIVAVSVAACTIYDMCKSVNKSILITDISLVSKKGGYSGNFTNPGS